MKEDESTTKLDNLLGDTSGFTLLEIIVVIAILALTTGIVIPLIGTSLRISSQESTEEEMENLEETFLQYFEDTNSLVQDTGNDSDDISQLETNTRGVSGWGGPYIVRELTAYDYATDAWKMVYRYTYSGGNSCTLQSAGPDRTFGTSDDITKNIDASMVLREKIERTRDELDVVKVAAEDYADANGGAYPANIATVFSAGFLSDESFRSDEWGNDYIKQTGQNRFISRGPNGVEGGGDDIYSH
jgi:general secretion pathway protein G